MGLCTQSFRPFRIGIHSSLAGWDGKSSQMNRATFRRSSQRDSRMASAFVTWMVFEGCWKPALLPTPLVIRSKRRCIGGRQGVGHPLRSHSNQVSQSAICLIQFCLYRYRIGLGFVSFFPKKHLIRSIAISTDSFLSVQRSSSRAFAICSELLRSRPLPCCTGIIASVCRPF